MCFCLCLCLCVGCVCLGGKGVLGQRPHSWVSGLREGATTARTGPMGWQRLGVHDHLIQSMSASTVLFPSSMPYTSCAGPKQLMCKGTLHALHMYAVVVLRLWLNRCFPDTFMGACTTCGDVVNAHHFGPAKGASNNVPLEFRNTTIRLYSHDTTS